MTQQSAPVTASMVAREVSKRTGKPCDGKRVRAWVRANVSRFDDDGYTAHAYTAAEHKRIVDALVARARGAGTGTNARSASAAQGRAGTPVKARKARKATPVKVTTPATPDPVA